MKDSSEIVAIWRSVNEKVWTHFSCKSEKSTTRTRLHASEYHVYENLEKSVREIVKQFSNNTNKHLKNYDFRRKRNNLETRAK
jgi:hypothetical protein